MDSDDKTQTESETRGTRGEQISEQKLPVHSDSFERSDEYGGQPERLPERVLGTSGAKKDPFGTVDQQLVQRLISQSLDRLQEAKDCIVWYQNQVDKLTKEVEELKKLSQLIETKAINTEEE
jgi:hypothetical protein